MVSTKAEIVEQAEKVFTDKAVRFAGAHPMAGSHKTGAAAADATILKMPIIFSLLPALDPGRYHGRVEELLSGLGSRFIEIDAEALDRVTSPDQPFSSYFSLYLVEQAVAYGEEHEMTMPFCGWWLSGYDTGLRKREPGMDFHSLAQPSSDIRAD